MLQRVIELLDFASQKLQINETMRPQSHRNRKMRRARLKKISDR